MTDATIEPDDERQAFELYWCSIYHPVSVSRRRDGTYLHPYTQRSWEAWLTRAAQQMVPVGYINAGHAYELQQNRIPYGYIYPQPGTGAEVAVFTLSPSAAAVQDRIAALQQQLDSQRLLLQQAKAMLTFAANNHKTTQELHQSCVVNEIAPTIAALQQHLGDVE